jgi:hypothetical protein
MGAPTQGGAVNAWIEFRSRTPPAGSLVVENHATTDLRLWRQGNSWGDAAVAFDVQADGRTTRLTRALQDYTRNVPASITVPPGGRAEFPFDLGDSTWQPAAALSQLDRPDAELAAVYSGGDSVERREQDVWPGELRSGYHALR